MRKWGLLIGLLALAVGLGVWMNMRANSVFLTAKAAANHSPSAAVDRQWSTQLAVDTLTTTAERLDLDIEGQQPLQAHRQRAVRHADGTLVWQGVLSRRGEPAPAAGTLKAATNTILLVSKNQRVTAALRWDSHVYRLYPKGDQAVLEEVNPAKLPADDESDTPAFTASPPPQSDIAEHQLEDTTIRVLVVASKNAGDNFEDVESEAQLAIEESNFTFHLSKIGLSFELAGFKQLDYEESAFYQTDLDRLWGRDDGYMDEVHPLRKELKADVVVLLRGVKNPGSCGKAADIKADADKAFAVVNIACIGVQRYTFAHEIGHLMGASHDGANGPITYGHGYVHKPAEGPKWYTVMAQSGEASRLPIWSSPEIEIEGIPAGNEEIANNRRVLIERKSIVAGFRDVIAAPASTEPTSQR